MSSLESSSVRGCQRRVIGADGESGEWEDEVRGAVPTGMATRYAARRWCERHLVQLPVSPRKVH